MTPPPEITLLVDVPPSFEAEWEVACRAGSTTPFFFGREPKFLEYYGLTSNNRSMTSSPFQSKMPNAFGLFDMHGNLWEWCHDWHSFVNSDAVTDPTGRARPDVEAFGRVYRGGGIATLSGDTNSSSRGYAPPQTEYSNLGFVLRRRSTLSQQIGYGQSKLLRPHNKTCGVVPITGRPKTDFTSPPLDPSNPLNYNPGELIFQLQTVALSTQRWTATQIASITK